MKKTTLIIPFLLVGLASTAQNTSEDSQVSGNGEITVFSREEILERIAANRQNSTPEVSNDSPTSSIATGNITATADEGVTALETETTGNATLTATSNGEVLTQEPSVPSVIPNTESVNTIDSQVSGNGEITVFSREEILERIEANRQNNEPEVSNDSPASSIATGNITVTADEGVTGLETETTGNATLTATSNGETIAEETSDLEVIAPVVRQAPINVRLFPNPARRSLVVLTPGARFSRIEITSTSGELLKSENVNRLSRARVDVSNLQEGLYFVTIYSEAGKTVERFFKR